MKCSICGGLVTWRGPMYALTHTECGSCGGRNCQIAEEEHECETCNGEGTIDQALGGEWNSDPKATCPDCDGHGYWTAPNAPLKRGQEPDTTN